MRGERVSDGEIDAILNCVDPDEPLHSHTWGLIQMALTELQHRRASSGEVVIPDRLRVERLTKALRNMLAVFDTPESGSLNGAEQETCAKARTALSTLPRE